MPAFRPVKRGDRPKFSAREWNAFAQAGRARQFEEFNRAIDTAPEFRQGDIIKVKNASESGLLRFNLLGLDAPIFSPSDSPPAFAREVAMIGVTPTSAHAGRFAILLDPIAAGKIGRAWVSGVCPTRVNVTSNGHTCADVDPGSTVMRSTRGGSAQMLWREGGTGEQWAIVRFGTYCGGASAIGRGCACPEDSYEVTPDCPPCAAYGRKMPRYWWLELSAEDNPYSESECEGTLCASIPPLFKLTNEADAYSGYPLCLWTGRVECFDVELSRSGDYYLIKIWDKNGCPLATLRKSVAAFDCCGPNEGWELVEGSVCNVTATLRPHECTCCDERPCPPPGEQICPEKCCENHCTLTMAGAIECPAVTCPEPPGECVPSEGIDVAGEVQMRWIGGCSWYGREVGDGYVREASWTWNGEKWVGRWSHNGWYVEGEAAEWDCASPVSLTVTGGSCALIGDNLSIGVNP